MQIPRLDNHEHGLGRIKIDCIKAYALTVTPPVSPVSSLGNMPVRNGALVSITSNEGVTGWGEIWCNFPPRGNLSRLNLLQDVIGPHLVGSEFFSYADVRPFLESRLARMAIHTGECGPFAHCLAGIDTALADLSARRADLSLAEYLNDSGPLKKVPVYASAPNVADLENAINDIISDGHRATKLKVGNGLDSDRRLLEEFFRIADGQLNVCIDANQNWTRESATQTLEALPDTSLTFIEEPLRADAPLSDWASVAIATPTPIAGGENITSLNMFNEFLDKGVLDIVQPDVAKWGGVSGVMDVAASALKKEASCTLHFMGTGLGLAASLQCLAAINGTGQVELDANPNPLRTELGDINLTVTDGQLLVPNRPGIGFEPDASALRSMTVAEMELA